MQKTGADILWECLLREEVRHVFGYPGGAILPAYDAMARYPIHHILVRHEQGATHAADGYARASGKVGVAIATSGPGATHMVTGIATAMMDSCPIVCITGQVPSSALGSDAFQEIDITGVTLPITKHNYVVESADEIAPAISEAFHIARSGRQRAVLVDITKDAQKSTCELVWPETPSAREFPQPQNTPTASDNAEAIRLIRAAKRPLILAEQGIIHSGVAEVVKRFAEQEAIPVAVTLLGIGSFPASHPLQLGMMGMHGEAWVNTAIQEADLLLAMRFDDRVTGNLRTYARRAKKDRPGVLNRVASLFRRRGFNVESLAVGHSERVGVSRITIGVEIEDGRDWHLEANLYRLSDGLLVKNLTNAQPAAREIAFIRVSLTDASPDYFAGIAKEFRAQVVDFTPEWCAAAKSRWPLIREPPTGPPGLPNGFELAN